MDKEFSEGFIHDIADLLELCSENKTDSTELYFNINGNTLKMDITFEIMKVGDTE